MTRPIVAVVSLLVAAGACARQVVLSSSPGSASAPVPLTASSIPSAYGIQGRFVGSASLRDGWIDVTIASGAVRMQQRDPRLYTALRVRASVARCTTRGQWETAAEGSSVRLAPALRTDENTGVVDVVEHAFADSIRLSVAVPRGTDLARSWVALILEWPFENDFVSYSLHTSFSLAAFTGASGAPRWPNPRDTPESVRCR